MIRSKVAHPRPHRATATVVATVFMLTIGLTGCGAKGGSDDAAKVTTSTAGATSSTTSTSPSTSTTLAPTTVTSAAPATTAPPATTPPASTPTAPGSGSGSGSGNDGGGAGAGGADDGAPLSEAEVRAVIKSRGDWDTSDLTGYDPRAMLSGVKAKAAGAMSGSAPAQVFLFSYGHYLGTATKTPRIAIGMEAITGHDVKITYGHYAAADPDCCPSLAPWVVNLSYQGSKLVPQGEFPPENQRDA